MKSLLNKICSVALLAALFAPALASANIPEPATVFYGQVVNRTTGQANLITDGDLVWTVRRPDGKVLTLTAALQPLADGRFSYRLAVPHEALTFGLTVSDAAVPLTAAAATCSHLAITVDGAPAGILAPGATTFSVAQLTRAATYRLDLELVNPLADTSGDGIPDWWKARHGITDPNADADGDGWSNLQEFRNGGNPTNDNRIPTLGTTEFWAYAEGRTVILLDAVDADSAPANISYTLTAPPAGGTFCRHTVNPDGSVTDTALGLNALFTQADVNAGKLVFVHTQTNAPAAPTSFTVNLRDENPAHTTSANVTLNVFRPGYPAAVNALAAAFAAAPVGAANLAGFAFDEQQMLVNYFLSRDQNYLVAESARATAGRTVQAASAGLTASQDRPHVIVGGAGDDRLVGGTAGDILIGNRGNDTLRGNGGADLFLIAAGDSGSETIEDFSVAAGDVLDLSRVLQGASTQLTNYLSLTTSGTNSVCAINFTGTGGGYTNLLVTLRGVQFGPANLRSLVDGGSILVGNKGLTPIISIVASVPTASQNGPTPGQFTLSRSGSVASALTVNLNISGSAVNGSSYELISSTATFAAGARTVNLPVTPYVTPAVLSVVAQVGIAAGSGYEVGSPATASVTIEPLAPQLTIEAIEPFAIKSDLTPGTFLITRSGIVANSLLVRLTIGGTASSSTDYNAISSFVNFAPNQTAALITITPKATANVNGNPRFVQVTLRPDAAYKIATPSSDRVFIVDQLFTRPGWQARYFPGNNEDWNTFANRDPGNTGIKNLQRYAFGLNPTNPAASSGMPLYQILNDRLCVTFRRPLTVTDFDYVVQVSDDMINWSALAGDVEAFTPANANTNDVETVSFRSKAGVSGRAKQFMRVQLQPR